MIGKLTVNDSKIVQPYISLSLLFFLLMKHKKKTLKKATVTFLTVLYIL
ncbi:hypothetical protein AB671_00552 [Chryseobacterium sp. BGARF1]|nr:hypothetical protein AB671_00552 [Chryseobacterium sp. BGARF1]